MNGELLRALMEASLSASVLILTLLPLRWCFQGRTPRWIFCLLWDLVTVRLLILNGIPSPVSAWKWAPEILRPRAPSTPETAVAVTEGTIKGSHAAMPPRGMTGPSEVLSAEAVLAVMWLAVALALAGSFLWRHLRSRMVYSDSLPCGDTLVLDWLALHSLGRRVQARTSDRIAAPLTYGILRPVILLPVGIEQGDLPCVLEHEYQHIRRFDTLRKAFLAAALCLHWFNPLVWALYFLANRDMELACDETVVHSGANREGYAMALLRLEEQRGQCNLSGSHFSQNALEERIKTIMKHKKISIISLIAVLAAMSVTATVFASAAPENKSKASSGQDAPEAGYAYDHFQSVENDLMILSQGGEDGEKQYSVDGGKTWLSEKEYHESFGGGDWQVEWWTAEDYAVWLEEEKQALQSIIGERGYTGDEGWFVWDQKRVDETIALYESILEDIKNGALYSKTITDKNGDVVEDVMLGSGTLGEATVFTFDEKDAVAPKAVDAAALLEELKPFGVGGNENLMTYDGRLIRYFVDGVPAGDNGYSIQYVYSNPDGVVDAHTLRSAIQNSDGSYNPMGELIGVASTGDEGFDQALIDSAAYADEIQAVTDTEESGGEDRAVLDQYGPFGLSYEWNSQRLRMSWNGTPVHSLYDTETGTWYANNMYGSDLPVDAVDLETVYRDGILRGLRESQPPHSIAHTAAAEGTGGEGGTPFEEIFAQYQPYGLEYFPRESGLGGLTWNSQAVKLFTDLKPDGSAFSYRDPDTEDGLRVFTEYDKNGKLTGLCAE